MRQDQRQAQSVAWTFANQLSFGASGSQTLAITIPRNGRLLGVRLYASNRSNGTLPDGKAARLTVTINNDIIVQGANGDSANPNRKSYPYLPIGCLIGTNSRYVITVDYSGTGPEDFTFESIVQDELGGYGM